MITGNKKVKLVNTRGRIIEVDEYQVVKLIQSGFMRAPEQPHEYNPVFDKDGLPAVQNKHLVEVEKVVKEKLEVDVI